MHRGYIKLWRKVSDSKMYRKHKLWSLWTWLLINVTHKEINVYAGLEKIKLLPGQIITGRKALAQELRMSERNIRTCLNSLSKTGNLTIKTTSKFSIITVINWHTYQPDEEKPTNKLTNNRPTSDQQVTTKQEHKNVKNEKNTHKACAWPCNFSLTDGKKQYAVENGIDPQKVGLFFEDFRDWAKAKGATYKDWDAAFRNRVRKAQEYGRQFLKNNGGDPKRNFIPDDEKITTGTELAAKRLERFKSEL